VLKETYIELLKKYSNNSHLINELWNEIAINYSHKKRHYHNSDHLSNLLIQLTKVKNEINNWDTVLFSLYYHDIIYNPLKSDNEERSAALAATRMAQISVPAKIIAHCKTQILATKKHQENPDTDSNYFTDADLSVLGQSWEHYSAYFKNVRKEYSIYPNLVYNAGRKKVLNHFLEKERIFKTDYFYTAFEQQAKQNIHKELELL
jgi:predicted metal-dependent HD superfamily phosphohydrolase